MNQDAKHILDAALRDALPGAAVGQALDQIVFQPGGRLILVAAGKAAWEMARAAHERLGGRIDAGVVVTKYDYSRGPLGSLEIYEAGHPVPDENSYRATARALEVVSGLTEADSVLFLLSGGGSALFEQPLIPAGELADITRQLLACGANIVEINTLRKRLSAVKGGRFALRCMPAHVYTVVLSDIIGDPLDMIASGPAYPDSSTSDQAREIARRYLQTSFDYITDGAGGMILLHPGLANPYQLVKRQQVGAMDSFEMSQQMVAGGMNGILPEEVPLHEAMCAALRGALRPELDVNDIAEDLRMLAKQNASLSEMESVLAESVTVLPTREMRDALRRLYEGTPRWLGLKAALEH